MNKFRVKHGVFKYFITNDNIFCSTFLSRNYVSSGIVATTPRSHPDSLLNISMLDYEEKNENLTKVSNYDSTILINNFVRSVLVNDFTKSTSMLGSLYLKVKKNPSETQINTYYSCFMILISHLIQEKEGLVIHDMKLLVDSFNKFEKLASKHDLSYESNEHSVRIKRKIVFCLIYCFINIPLNQNLLRHKVSQYIQMVLKQLNLTTKEISEEIEDENLFKNFLQITETSTNQMMLTNYKSKFRSKLDEDFLIDSFKDESGFISFDNLCEYISSSRFTKYDKNSQSKLMYEIYESLNAQEKEVFLKEYLEFNRSREINIESHSLDLVDGIDSSSSKKQAQILNLSQFSTIHTSILNTWFENSLKDLSSRINKINNENSWDSNQLDKSEEEIILSKYIMYLNLLPRKVLISLIISQLLTKTITTEEGHAKLIDLVDSLTLSFRRLLLKDLKYSNVKNSLLKFFKQEDGAKLFSTLIKIVIGQCKIPASLINMESFKSSLLITESYYSLDKSFFTAIDGSYPGFLWGLFNNSTGGTFKRTGVIRVHPYFVEQLTYLNSLTLSKSLYLPMLTPPKEWITPKDGGYLNDLKPIIQTKDLSSSLFYLNKAHQTGQLDFLYQGLNTLGSNAWTINKNTLNIFHTVMKYEKGFLKIPPQVKNLKINIVKPERSEYLDSNDFERAKFQFKKESIKIIQDFHNLKSQRMEFDMILKLSKSFGKNGDIFYLPHNIDFRGRAYPMVSLLSHYQGDLVRSLLCFWFAKPLGKNGFDWIKYQLAGVYGMDKLSKQKRLEFVDQNWNLIIDSARNPLDGKKWWKKGEKPWQTLALCFEIDAIIKFAEAGNKIEDYLCRIPVHQDGSCNGLQHYAALGKDEEGGKSVNLTAAIDNNKADVYSKVLDIVKDKVQTDMFNDNVKVMELANLTFPLLNRKLIKQTVMTTVYGVTRFGGAAQIQERIKELIKLNEVHLLDDTSDATKIESFEILKSSERRVAVYLSKIVLNSVSELFQGAKLIQDWLLMNCNRIIHSFDLKTNSFVKNLNNGEFDFFKPLNYKPMMWTTLAGFPVVQLYKNSKNVSLHTTFQQLKINKPSKISTINTRKQMNAIAPNFIHSIDSLHMLMTCIAANKQNIPFVAVHDSFWSYPSDIDELSKIIRKEFINLHSASIIEHMRDDMLYTARNSFQLVWVKNSENKELVSELERLRNSYFPEASNSTNADYNKFLDYELVSQSKNLENSPLKLINKYQPSLYFRPKRSASTLEIYSEYSSPGKTINFSRGEFTPLLAPVKVLQIPPTGELDIRQVLQSTYFFS